MKVSNVDEIKKAETLAAAIPAFAKKDMDANTINEMIKKQSNKNAMEPDDYVKFLKIDNLPSKYLYYPEGTAIYGKPLIIPQLKKIANMTPLNASTTLDDIIRSAVRGIDINEILISDKLYIILWLRANTYPDSGYCVPFTCDSCDNISSFDFKVDDIDINYIRDDIKFESPLELSTKDFIICKYPRIKDETRIQKFKDSVKKSFEKYDEDILNLTMTIDTVNGKEMSVMEMYNFISDTKIYSQIKGYADDFNFGISSILNVKCNKCGGTIPTGLSFREDFVIPSYKFTQSSRNGISNK